MRNLPVRQLHQRRSCATTFVSDAMSKMVSAVIASRDGTRARLRMLCDVRPTVVPHHRTAPGMQPFPYRRESTTASGLGMQRTSPAPVRLV